ncbi:hypothetical protein V7798_21510 [Rhizobium laguerreae]
MSKLYLHIKHADSMILDTEGKMFADLYEASEEALDSLREIVAKALLSRNARIPHGISICAEDGTILREIAVDRAIPEIAQRLRSIGAG